MYMTEHLVVSWRLAYYRTAYYAMSYRHYLRVDFFPLPCDGHHHGNDKIVPYHAGMGMSCLTYLTKLHGRDRALQMRAGTGDHLQSQYLLTLDVRVAAYRNDLDQVAL